MSAAPKTTARLTGALYLLIIVAAMFCETQVRGTLIVGADAAKTAHNILANESLFRLGGALDIVTYLADVAVAALLYQLTKPAGKTLALVAAYFRLAYSAMAGVLCIFWFGALRILDGDGLAALAPETQQALALAQLQLRSTGFVVALIFFGVHIFLLGALLIRARYLPAWIGVLLLIAGGGYIINSFAALLAPTLDTGVWLLLPGFVAELSLALWLLVVGLNGKAWNESA
jgi:Domain of unknown function (DUF4386)